MFVHYLTKGIVLDKKDVREADQRFVLYTKKFGKIFLLARSSRKIKSKLRGGLKLFNLSQVEFIQGRNQKTLTDSFIEEDFENISKSLVKLKTAYKISELLKRLTSEEEKDLKVWSLSKKTFERLNEIKSLKEDLKNYYYFFWNFAKIIGFEPHFKTGKSFFLEKGILYYNKKEFASEAVKVIRVILEKDWNYFLKVNVKKEHFDLIKKISDSYYLFLSESMK
jgi:DNA repair protein RecO